MTKKFGEIKTRRNIFPSQVKKIIETGTVDILIIQAKASQKTKNMLNKSGITLYEGVEPSEVDRLREVIAKELESKEKKETE
ncbi:hypothetical protein ABLV54_19920 [Klebsiella sp. JB_Kp042]|uniref:hypothetical protein n=1 Tax=Klebsiella TaxID=570 RepID=UPI00200BE8F2|nr:hypothetical protein [Klebsiella quasipneumoniae]HBS5600641.1 hypothetical protein [Klebsiella quasipneumoniae subsp. quasipneumoniae]HCE0277678.1 hypothetical protein [Klebsiella pneumoniae]MCL1442297.1 hypothetical protein [Klebsiella quasipneumoniae]HBQ8755646.1 hypothetical protein [Klebsiella quasipneumoniae]HCE0282480.1 hypothetical protein [Klebsiella pneumoniae]